MRRRVPWQGWRSEVDSWRMCRIQCAESGRRCRWVPGRLHSMLVGRRAMRVVYSQRFISQWLDAIWEASRRETP